MRCLPGAMGQFHTDIKALAGAQIKNLYRLRVGDYRIVYTVGGGEVLAPALQRRDETTYAADRFAILRHGTGLKIVEVAPAAVAPEPTVAGRAPRLFTDAGAGRRQLTPPRRCFRGRGPGIR